MTKRISIIIVLLILVSLQTFSQQDSTKKESAFTYKASYVGDVVNNVDGGIKTGTNYLGLGSIGLGFNTEKAKWWKGGEFHASINNIHGDEPSANLIGDIQFVSNIEAGNLTLLYECWYKQSLGNFQFTVGLQDLNKDYAVTENGALFLNSSFGTHAVMSQNISLPTYPLTALGASVKWHLSNYSDWQLSVFDGTPNSRNAFNTNWIIGKKDGYLLTTEFHLHKSLIKGREGCYKLGGYYHQHRYFVTGTHENGGFYFIGDQNLNNKLSVFTQIGYSPNNINIHNHFYSLGVTYKSFSSKRINDEMGIAMAYFGIDKSDITHEMAIEMTYHFQLNEHIYLQPDIQYIINPAGTGVKLDNALVGILRFGVEL